ncbi:hypothetical protein C2G38_2201506 [Gigaspora rosea]|uniref:Uncharacterized protein n=1 Tax=Gigaspora rosea TaxID=44941 RepID=A0A397UPM0_9GLOM|nr:hypothetical protein C2G38_2201506 [Gigaspora rosea]
MKEALGIVESLELSFQFKGKDKLVSGSDELWLHETKIDPYNEKISIYGGVIPFYKNLSDDLESNISSLDISRGNHTSYKTRPEGSLLRNKRKKKILDTECPTSQRDDTAYESLSSSSSGSDSDSSSYKVIVVKAKKRDCL